MTDENKFFRYLWRFNAVFLAGVGLVVACGAIYSVLTPWRSDEPAPAGHFAPVPRAAENEFTYRLESNGQRRAVGQEVLIALERWKGSPETYGLQELSSPSARYDSRSRSVNFLAVNPSTAESRWVFDGYGRMIIGGDLIDSVIPPIPVPLVPGQVTSPAIALVMTVVDADTNKDGELTEKDRKSLFVYRAGAIKAVRLFTADLIVSRQQTDNYRYLVIYENGSSAVAATYSLPDFKLIAEKPLPKVPNG